MSGFSLKFLQDVNRMMNEGRWDMGDDSVAKPRGKIPTSNAEARFRQRAEKLRRENGELKNHPNVQNIDDYVDAMSDHFQLDRQTVWNIIHQPKFAGRDGRKLFNFGEFEKALEIAKSEEN